MTKRNVVCAVLILSCTLLFSPIYSGCSSASEGGGAQGIKGCSALSSQGIKDILMKLNAPAAKVVSITESPLRGFCEVVIDNMGRLGIFYLAVDKKTLIFGSLIDVSDMSNKTQESVRKILDKKRIDTAKIPLSNALILGENNASRKVVVFTDPDCSFCGQFHKTMKQIIAKREDIAFYIKFLPLPMHKDAHWKAKSIVCNKSMKMLEDNFEKKAISKTECATDEINSSLKLAASFGISGTPSFILPDGRLREGAMPEAELLDLIDGKK